jgi:hemerythrin
MSLFTWNESYSVGSKEMDTHHQRLFELMDKFQETLKHGRGKEVVGTVIKELMDYGKYHFAAEEKHMIETKYPGYAEQKRTHDAFIEKVNKLHADQDPDYFASAQSVSTLSSFLVDWLIKHIQTLDKQYEAHFREHGVQ